MPSPAGSVNGDEHGAALVGLWAEQTDNACSVFSQQLLHAFGDGHELEDSLSLLPSALKKEDTRGVCPGPAMKKPHKDSRVEICTAHVSYWFSILPLPPRDIHQSLGTFEVATPGRVPLAPGGERPEMCSNTTVHRTGPTTRSRLAPNVESAKVANPATPVTGFRVAGPLTAVCWLSPCPGWNLPQGGRCHRATQDWPWLLDGLGPWQEKGLGRETPF